MFLKPLCDRQWFDSRFNSGLQVLKGYRVIGSRFALGFILVFILSAWLYCVTGSHFVSDMILEFKALSSNCLNSAHKTEDTSMTSSAFESKTCKVSDVRGEYNSDRKAKR